MTTIISQHRRKVAAKLVFGATLVILILLCGWFSLVIGAYPVSFLETISVLTGRKENFLSHIIWHIRMPRILAAMIAGASLGVAGAVMQNLLRNPLASPFTLGVSQGAAFGAAFSIIVLGRGFFHSHELEIPKILSQAGVVFFAFFGAMLSTCFILICASWGRMSSTALILAGVAVSAFFSAATMLLQYLSTEMQVAATVFWTFGDVARAGWRDIMMMAIVFTPVMIYFMFHGWHYNAMIWGDDVARGLGVRVRSLRILGMTLASLVAAVTVAFLGIIGFIGLLSPHIVRLFVGEDHRFLLPYSALFGAILLMGSDTLSRILLAPVVLPVGIITAFAGSPLLIYLLFREGRSK